MYRGGRGLMAPFILNFGNRWSKVASFRLLPFQLLGKLLYNN